MCYQHACAPLWLRLPRAQLAPDGLQPTFTRYGKWRAGEPGVLASRVEEGARTPFAMYSEQQRGHLEFLYDYGGELYKYEMVARAVAPPRPEPAHHGEEPNAMRCPLLPERWASHGPQLLLTGRWQILQTEPDTTAGANERGRVWMCRMWRAECAYTLLPEDPTVVEAKLEDVYPAEVEAGYLY